MKRDQPETLLTRARRRVHIVLDGGRHDPVSLALHWALIVLVVASVAAVVLDSEPALSDSYGRLFSLIEYIAVAAFTIEYLLRLWCAPEHLRNSGRTAFHARFAFARSPSALVDLMTILPAYLSFFTTADLRVLLLLRLLRFFKLARYSAGIRSLVHVLEAERKALIGSAIILFGGVLFSSAAIHIAEHEAQPEAFGSIPDAMWWAIVTITTVGYGDVTPVTLAGRAIAALTMVTGYVMLGLPVGIVATAFAEEIHRRDFVVTWSMVANVPLFRGLDASAIGEITRYLRAQAVPEGAVIVRKGEAGNCMYFIAEGEVEVETAAGLVRLERGQFFGEMALINKAPRNANVRALRATKLLILDSFDLQTLTRRNPEVGAEIAKMAAKRQTEAPAKSDASPEAAGK